jgi:hypothetical protein
MASIDVDIVWHFVKAALRALDLLMLAIEKGHPHVMKIELENARRHLRGLLERLEDAELEE